MKKKILSIAIVLAGLVGSTAFAQTPSSTDSSKEKTETTVSQKDKKDKKGKKDKKNRKGKKNKCQRPNPFAGINLNEKQQAELKALNEGIRVEKSKIESKEKVDRKAMIEQRKKDEKEYLGKIKEILSPEQYVQFLENSFLNNRYSRPFGKMGMRQGKDGKKFAKDGKQGPRGDRNKGNRDNKRNAPTGQA